MKKKESDENRSSIIVTFKVDEEMALLLKSLPNRSEFIRDAIRAKIAIPCPACGGSGRMSQTQALDIKSLLDAHYIGRCTNCRVQLTDITCRSDHNKIGEGDFIRINQARGGGPLYCHDCFSQAKLCSKCHVWWHPSEKNHVLPIEHQ